MKIQTKEVEVGGGPRGMGIPTMGTPPGHGVGSPPSPQIGK